MLRKNYMGFDRLISAEAVGASSTPDKANRGVSRSVARGLLLSSVFTTGLVLVNVATLTPALATACSTAANFANQTQCIGGNSPAGLVYTGDNPLYTTGDFTLLLDTHDVNAAAGENGITFSGVSPGDDGTIILRNDSDVVSGSGGNGIESTATGATTTINVEDTSSVQGDLAGINAQSNGGDITVNTQSGTTVLGDNGSGILAAANGAGNVVVDAQGQVTSTNGASDGITAIADSGTVQVTTGTGAITGANSGIEAIAQANTSSVTTGTGAVVGLAGDGINNTGATGATVSSNGTVTGTGGNGINAISTGNGNVSVTTNGAAGTLVSGTGGDGINAEAQATGNVDVEVHTAVTGSVNGIDANAVDGTVEVTTDTAAILGQAGNGIDATASGLVTVGTGGNVTGTGGVGINAQSSTGNVNVTTNGAAGTLISGTGGAGINASSGGVGAVVDVEVHTAVTGSTIGIDAHSDDGTVEVTTDTAAILGQAGNGIDATALGGVTVGTGGNVTGTTGIGINAVAEEGNVSVTTNGAAGTLVSGTGGAGILANANTSGNTDVEVHTAVTGSTIGIDANATNGTVEVTTDQYAVNGQAGHGIDATASGLVTVSTGGNVTGTGGIGINAVSGTNGNVNVTTNGAAGTLISGTTGAGIFANADGTGNTDVEVHTAVTGSTIGIDANADSGTVEVTTDTSAILGQAGDGIQATASGNVTVETRGLVTGIGGSGIAAQSSDEGNIQVTTLGAVGTEVFGTGGSGIDARTTGAGTITIQNSVRVLGDDAGVSAASEGGLIRITNDLLIANAVLDSNPLLADSEVAIQTKGGPTIIENNSDIVGRVLTGNSADQLINDDLWVTEEVSNFGDGDDVIDNNNAIRAGDEAGTEEFTRFENLENLNNNALGTIDLKDQDAGDGSNLSDRLEISGNYNGLGGDMVIDAFLGGPGSKADVLDIGGDVTGVTEIYVTDTNAGPGGYNPTGILVAHAAGDTAAGDFILADGPIDKGLFFYDLLFDAANGDHLLVGLPDREVFETLAAVSSSQEIWRETADAWSTRQENLRDVLATRQVVTGVADPGVVEDNRPMGSLWVSALGSWAERDNEASFSILNGSFEFDTSYQQDIYGMVGGADFRADMGGDTSMLFGVMGGYVDSKLNFDESSTSIDTNGGTVGAYAALMSGGFFATVLVKADLLNMDYTVGSLAEDDNDDANVTTWGVRGDMGYRFGDSLFVEPMLSVDGISTKIDEFTIGGVDIDAGTNESFRGGAGVRAGYSDDTIRASATARVWDVFSTDNEVDVLADVPLGITDDGMEGVYGDVSGQIDVNLSTSATVYLKGGILFSDDVTKPNASGGFAFYW